MTLNFKQSILAIGLPMLLGNACGAVIDFSALVDSDGTAFTSYTEGGYVVSVLSGNWFVAQSLSSSPPSIYAHTPSGDSLVSVSRGGQAFTLQSFDVETIGGQSGWEVTGSHLGNVAFVLGGPYTADLGLVTIDLSSVVGSTTIDFLSISVRETRFEPTYLDNLNVGVVPEPSSACLLTAGLIAAFAGARTKKCKTLQPRRQLVLS